MLKLESQIDAKDIDLASHIILPGQGAFEACMEWIKKHFRND